MNALNSIAAACKSWLVGEYGTVTSWCCSDGVVKYRALVRADGKIISTVDGCVAKQGMSFKDYGYEPGLLVTNTAGTRFLVRPGGAFQI
jgi:hypothetical protein